MERCWTLSERALEGLRHRQEARREPEDGADVDRLAAPRLGPRPLVAPAGECGENGDQVTSALGQLVVHARRDLAVPLTREQAVGDHAIETRPQLLGRDAWQGALQLDEPPRTADEITDDQQRPLVADEIKCPGIGRPLVVRMPFGRGAGEMGNLRWDESGATYLP